MASAGSRQQWLKGMLEPSAPVDPAAAAAAVAEADRQRRRRRSLCIAALVLLALAGVGVLAGLLVKASLDRRGEQASADSGASALAAPTAAVPASDVVQLEGKDRFYWEAQAEHIQEEEIFMPLTAESLLVQAQDGGGSMPFAYAGPGPCRSLRVISNITLDLSAAATGCRGLGQCQIGLRLAMPEPGSCPQLPAPYPTVFLVPGFSCQPSYYKTWLERLASWGYAVITYERPLAGQSQPAAEVELSYFDAVMGWRNAANTTQRGGRFLGLFSAGPVATVGHSMGGGLAAITAGTHPDAVGAAVLIDPVDYTHLSRLVARQYLAQYAQPVLMMRAEVVCLDRRGCVPPQDHVPTPADITAFCKAGYCTPDWHCCNWDDGTPGLEEKFGIAQPTDGPTGFAEFSPPGSWMARFKFAGHTSIALERGSLVFQGTTCPTVLQPEAVVPDAVALTTAYLDARLRGQAGAEEFALQWANARPMGAISLELKGQAQAPVAVA